MKTIKNKKVVKVIKCVAIGSLLFASVLGGLGISSAINGENSSISFSINGKKTVLNENQMTFIEDYFISKNKNDKKPDNDSSTFKRLVANWMITHFYQASLSGQGIDFSNPDKPIKTDAIEGSILGGKGTDWRKSELLQLDKLIIQSLFIKIMNDTKSLKTGNSFYSSLLKNGNIKEKKEHFDNFENLMNRIVAESQGAIADKTKITYWIFQKEYIKSKTTTNVLTPLFDNVIKDFLSDSTSRTSLLKQIYSYAYLQQKSGMFQFDYKVTEELYDSNTMVLWKMDIAQAGNFETGKESEYHTKSWDSIDIKTGEIFNKSGANIKIGGTQNNITWKYIYENDKRVSEKTNKKEIDASHDSNYGFKGIVSKSDAGISNVDESQFWKQDNTWRYSGSLDHKTDTPTLVKGGNIGVAPARVKIWNDRGSVMTDKKDSEKQGSVYAFVPLRPFGFPTKWKASNSTSPEWVWRFETKKDTAGKIYRQKDDKNASNWTTTTTVFNELVKKEWFGTNNDKQLNFLLLSSLSSSNKKIFSNAMKYWNYKGFNIELKGKYKDDYGSLIDIDLQK